MVTEHCEPVGLEYVNVKRPPPQIFHIRFFVKNVDINYNPPASWAFLTMRIKKFILYGLMMKYKRIPLYYLINHHAWSFDTVLGEVLGGSHVPACGWTNAFKWKGQSIKYSALRSFNTLTSGPPAWLATRDMKNINSPMLIDEKKSSIQNENFY